MKRALSRGGALVLCLATAATVAACGSGDDGSTSTGGGDGGASAKEVEVAIVLPGLDNPFFRDIRDGAEEAVKGQEGVKLDVVGPGTQSDGQAVVNLIQDQVAKGSDGIGVVPVDPDLYGPAVRRIAADDIPVVGLGQTEVGDTKLTAGLTFDQEGATKDAMATMVEQMGGKGDAAFMTVPGDVNIEMRLKAARESLDADGIPIVAEVPGDCELKGLNATEDVLQKHPDVAGMFVACGTGAVQSSRAFKAAGRKPDSYVLWGFDGTPEEYKAIDQGWMDGTVRFDGKKIGALFADTLVKAARDEQIDGPLTAPHELVTKENVAQFLEGGSTN